MQIHTIADLFDPATLSLRRLADAVLADAPAVVRASRQPKAAISWAQLPEAVAQALPAVLEVGLCACILRYWWRTQAGSGPWPAQMRWQLQPHLDWLDQGQPSPPLYLQATVELVLSDSTIQWSAQERLLQLDTSRGWQARLQLGVSDAPGAAAACFYDRRSQAYLPAGPWDTPFD